MGENKGERAKRNFSGFRKIILLRVLMETKKIVSEQNAEKCFEKNWEKSFKSIFKCSCNKNFILFLSFKKKNYPNPLLSYPLLKS